MGRERLRRHNLTHGAISGRRSNDIKHFAHSLIHDRHSGYYHCMIVFYKVYKEKLIISPYAYYFADLVLHSIEKRDVQETSCLQESYCLDEKTDDI